MRYGLFGGTFDPIHLGHLITAEVLAEKLSLDKVVFIPAGVPPHKKAIPITSANHRVNMVKLAIKDNPKFTIDLYEINKTSPSYTIETVEYFKRKFPDDEIILLIGADSLPELPDWFKFDELIGIVEIKSAYRGGFDINEVFDRLKVRVSPDQFEKLKNSIIRTNMIEISATDIRTRIREGRSIKYLVPEDV